MTTVARIAEGLGLTKSGDRYYGICPVCSYEGAFSVEERNGRVLVHCHVGCTQDEVIKALREWDMWGNSDPQTSKIPPHLPIINSATSPNPSRRDAALSMWARAQAAEGTVVEKYLRARGYNGHIPETLRYVSGKHPSDEQFHPVMIAGAVMLGQQEIAGVHRTFLRSDGSGKAPLDRPKMSLGVIGGAGVPLTQSPLGQKLVVSEGIETGLSVLQATGIPTVAALSTGGLKALLLPKFVSEILIAADADEPGTKAANAAAARWHAEGRKVLVVKPTQGSDFNDLARSVP